MNSKVSDSLPVSTSTNHLCFFCFCFFFPAVILLILMFLQKETTFKRELKYFQQFLVSICVIFYLIFFLFCKVRNENDLHGHSKDLDLHCSKIRMKTERILQKQTGFSNKHNFIARNSNTLQSTLLINFRIRITIKGKFSEELNLLKLIGEYQRLHCCVIKQLRKKIYEV